MREPDHLLPASALVRMQVFAQVGHVLFGVCVCVCVELGVRACGVWVWLV